MREYLAIVRAILAGESPPEGQRWRSNFAFMGLTRARTFRSTWPAVAGDAAAGRGARRRVLLWATPADYVCDVVVPEVTAGRRRAARTLMGSRSAPRSRPRSGGTAAQCSTGCVTSCTGILVCRSTAPCSRPPDTARTLAAYDAAAPDRDAQKLAISEEFIDSLCALGDVADVQRGIARYRQPAPHTQ